MDFCLGEGFQLPVPINVYNVPSQQNSTQRVNNILSHVEIAVVQFDVSRVPIGTFDTVDDMGRACRPTLHFYGVIPFNQNGK